MEKITPHLQGLEGEWLKVLIDNLPDEIWLCDAEANLCLANRAALEWLGLEQLEEATRPGSNWLEKLRIYHPDGTPRAGEETPLLRSLRGETLEGIEEVFLHPNTGMKLYKQVNSSPVRAETGEIIGAVVVMRDVTAVKTAQQGLQDVYWLMEKRIKERKAALKELNERLKQEIEQHKRTMKTLRDREEELGSLAKIFANILRTFDLEERLNLILDEIMKFAGVEVGGLHLVQGDQLVLRAWRGLSSQGRHCLLAFPVANVPVWLRGERVVCIRSDEEPHIPPFAREEGIQTWANLPLALFPRQEGRGRRWIGNLFLAGRNSNNALKEAEIQPIRDMAEYLALAIDHSRAHQEARQRLFRLEALKEIDRAIIRRLDLKELLRGALEHVPKELGADAAAVSLFERASGRPKVSVMRLPNGTIVEEEAFTLAESLLHWFMERRETVIIYDLAQDPRLQMHRAYINSHRLASYLGVPLVGRDKVTGILHILSKEPRVFAEEDVEFFKILAGQLAIAIENARLFQEAQLHALQMEAKVEDLERGADALRKSQARLSEAQRIGRMGHWEWDVVQDKLEWSEEIYRIFGVASSGFGGTYEALLQLVHPEDRGFVRRAVDAALHEGRPYDIEHRIVLPDGSERIVRERGEVTRDETGRPLRMMGTVQDVTRERNLERVARIREKMASLGQVAAGIAHEIRNPLSGIHLLLETVKENLKDPDSPVDVENLIDEAQAAAGKIEAVVKRVMDFSRPTELRMRPLDINGPIMEAVRLVSAGLRKAGIEVQFNLAADLPMVQGDFYALEEVVVNLLLNASDAMAGTSSPKRILISSYAEKDEVVVTVGDSGPGIPSGMRERIFEPFYSTREEGSGIGLNICQRIVLDHGGSIQVSDSPLGGADFILRIPISVEKGTQAR